MDIDSLPNSTDFVELHGRLAEWSQMDCRLPGGQIRLEEIPQTTEEVKGALDTLGIKDDFEGQTHWEINLDLPCEGLDTLTVVAGRDSRGGALRAGQALEEMLLQGKTLPGELDAHILSYPSEDKVVPAMLWADLEVEGVGKVSAHAASDTLAEALAILRRVLPGASLNS